MPILFPPDAIPTVPATSEKSFPIRWFSASIEVLPVANTEGAFVGRLHITERAMAEDLSLHPSFLLTYDLTGEKLQEALGGANPACPNAAAMMGTFAANCEEIINFILTPAQNPE